MCQGVWSSMQAKKGSLVVWVFMYLKQKNLKKPPKKQTKIRYNIVNKQLRNLTVADLLSFLK